MTPEYTIVGLLVTGITALFSYVVKLQADAIKAKDIALAGKDDEIAWLRAQLGLWAPIAKTGVVTAEKLTDKAR